MIFSLNLTNCPSLLNSWTLLSSSLLAIKFNALGSDTSILPAVTRNAYNIGFIRNSGFDVLCFHGFLRPGSTVVGTCLNQTYSLHPQMDLVIPILPLNMLASGLPVSPLAKPPPIVPNAVAPTSLTPPKAVSPKPNILPIPLSLPT